MGNNLEVSSQRSRIPAAAQSSISFFDEQFDFRVNESFHGHRSETVKIATIKLFFFVPGTFSREERIFAQCKPTESLRGLESP